MDWQPIEIVPQETGRFLAYCAKQQCVTLAFYAAGHVWGEDGRFSTWQFTHWMQLPDPPISVCVAA
jgi:hypothetical protein